MIAAAEAPEAKLAARAAANTLFNMVARYWTKKGGREDEDGFLEHQTA